MLVYLSRPKQQERNSSIPASYFSIIPFFRRLKPVKLSNTPPRRLRHDNHPHIYRRKDPIGPLEEQVALYSDEAGDADAGF